MEYVKQCNNVYFILNNLDTETKKKIPQEIYDFLNINRNKEYEVTICLDKPIYEQNLDIETVELLSELYQNYLCSKEDMIGFIREKYSKNKVTESTSLEEILKSKRKAPVETAEKSLIIVKEKNIIQKLMNLIKKWL